MKNSSKPSHLNGWAAWELVVETLELLNSLVGGYVNIDGPLFMLSILLLIGVCTHYALAFVVALTGLELLIIDPFMEYDY